MSVVDYKKKYHELKIRFVQGLDAAFKQGYIQGRQEAQQEYIMQQQQQQQQMAAQQQAAMGQIPQDQGQAGAPNMANMSQDELGQYINDLESIVNKSEMNPQDLKKSVERLKEFQEKMQRPKSFSYTHNLNEDAKKNVTQQEKIVEDILTKWDQESKHAETDIKHALSIEGILSKKEE